MPHPEDKPAARPMTELADGWQHHFKPLDPLDVHRAGSASDLLAAMSKTAFSGRSLGEAADILVEMARDEKCFVIGTFSGAMSIAKQGLMLTEMIDQGLLHAVVSTGALMCHGLVEQSGHTHFAADPAWTDERLYDAGYCRVYDTLELERNLEEAADIMQHVLEHAPTDRPLGSHEINWLIGDYVRQHVQGRGILQSAAAKKVPVYIPSFTDSELGLDLFVHNLLAREQGRPPVQLDLMRDIADYYERAAKAERMGIFTIGGGVPRNWAQQVGPPRRDPGAPHLRPARRLHPLPLCHPHLPGAGPLGRPFGLHVLGRRFLGQVRLGEGRRPARGGLRGRDDRLAAAAARRAGAAGAGVASRAAPRHPSGQCASRSSNSTVTCAKMSICPGASTVASGAVSVVTSRAVFSKNPDQDRAPSSTTLSGGPIF